MALYNTTTRAEFEDKVLNNEKTVLVDFWAEWCPPCRAMAPILHDVAEAMDKDVDIVKVNIEDGVDNAALRVNMRFVVFRTCMYLRAASQLTKWLVWCRDSHSKIF